MHASQFPLWLGLLLSLIAFPAGATNLRVGVGTGCDQATLQAALNLVRTQTGTHTIRINKGNYAVPNGMLYDPTVVQTAVFLEGGYDSCTAVTPSGDPTLDSDRAVFNGAGGSQRSVLDLLIYGNVGTFQIRRIVLTGGDATDTGGSVWPASGGGLAVRGRASVLLGLGASIKGNAAIDGGGVVLTGSTVLDTAGVNKADLYIVEGAEIANNTATDRGGGIYCGGSNPTVLAGPNIDRHGSIIFAYGTLAFNQAARGAAFYCRGTVEGGGGLQPRPPNGLSAWILGNQISSGGSGCAAGDGTLDATIPVGPSGFRELGAANGENGLLAITNNRGASAGLCLIGSSTLGNVDDRPPASNQFRLLNLYVANQIGEGGSMALRVSSGLQLFVQPSGNAVPCSFFSPTPCVTIENNDMGLVGGFLAPSTLLTASNVGALVIYRASVRGNRVGGSLLTATSNALLRLHSSILDDNQVLAFSSIDGNTTSLMFAQLSSARVDLYQSTVVMRSALTRFYRLDSGGSGTVHGSILASTAAPAPLNVGGTSPPSSLTREWCGFFQSTADFASHTVINDPTTGTFVVHPPVTFNLDPTTYAPLSAGLIDACSTPAAYNLDFYGRPFNVQLEFGGPVRSDIGAVEAQLPNDIIFANGFD